MALCVKPPPHGFSQASRSSKISTEWPARASCSPHIAPEGPPPTIAMSVIWVFFLTASDSVAGPLNNIAEPAERLGPVLQAILCDREDNHRKSSEEYSTEESRRQRRSGTLSDNIHTCTLEQAEHRQIRCKQHQEDLAIM